MPSVDIEALVSAIDSESPSGDDLEYDPEFRELEEAARGKPEHTSAGETIEAEPPHWKDVRKRAEALFARTRDLRVGCHLARALLHTDGMAGFRDGLLVIKALLLNQWDTVHPLLDPDDASDPTRSNALLSLADPAAMLAELRRTPLVTSKILGAFSLRSVLLATAREEPLASEEVEIPDPAHIDAAFRETDLDALQATAVAAQEALAACGAIETVLAEQVGVANAPDLANLKQALDQIATMLGQRLEARGVVDEEAVKDASETGPDAGSPAEAVSAVVGEIRSREDAIRMLDRVSEYFERNEPSSPVPLLLQRAKRLVAMSFLDILRDLTPDGVAQAESIGGVTNSSE